MTHSAFKSILAISISAACFGGPAWGQEGKSTTATSSSVDLRDAFGVFPSEKADADSTCEVGSEPSTAPAGNWTGGLHPTSGGVTPLSVAGAQRVSPLEAICLIRTYRKSRFITPIADNWLIRGSARIKDGWQPGTFSDTIQANVAAQLELITGGDKNFPLISYCHHANCFMSYNLILRAKAAGYTNLYWLRDGIEGWFSVTKKDFVAGGFRWPGESDMPELRTQLVQHEERRLVNLAYQQKNEAFQKRVGPVLERHGEALKCHAWADEMMREGSDSSFWQTFKRASTSAALDEGMTEEEVTATRQVGFENFSDELKFAGFLDNGSREGSAILDRKPDQNPRWLADTKASIDKRCRAEAIKY